MITDEEFQRISVYMKANYGIDLSQKKVIINGRLENYLRKGGYGSCTEYLNALGTDKTGTLEKMLVNLLTTNHTYFMREFEHFEYFRKEVLPWLKKKQERGARKYGERQLGHQGWAQGDRHWWSRGPSGFQRLVK